MFTPDLILETLCQRNRPPCYWPFHKYWFAHHRWYYLEWVVNNFRRDSLIKEFVQLPPLFCGVRKLKITSD